VTKWLTAAVFVLLAGCSMHKPYICVPAEPRPSMICWPGTVDEDTGLITRDIDIGKEER